MANQQPAGGVGYVPDCLMSFRQHYPEDDDRLDHVQFDIIPLQDSVNIRRSAQVKLNLRTVQGPLPNEICLTVRLLEENTLGEHVRTPDSQRNVGILQVMQLDANISDIRPTANGKILVMANSVSEVNIVVKFNCSMS